MRKHPPGKNRNGLPQKLSPRSSHNVAAQGELAGVVFLVAIHPFVTDSGRHLDDPEIHTFRDDFPNKRGLR
jgi:hypothetical protein